MKHEIRGNNFLQGVEKKISQYGERGPFHKPDDTSLCPYSGFDKAWKYIKINCFTWQMPILFLVNLKLFYSRHLL